MSHSETEYAVALIRRVTAGQDAGDGGARHAVVFDLADTITRAGLRPGDRLGAAGGDPRQPRGAGSLSGGKLAA